MIFKFLAGSAGAHAAVFVNSSDIDRVAAFLLAAGIVFLVIGLYYLFEVRDCDLIHRPR